MSNRLKPLTAVWLKNPDGTLTAARIETRRGGVYQIEVLGETRRVTRQQIKRMK
jgi:hypothetical protein